MIGWLTVALLTIVAVCAIVCTVVVVKVYLRTRGVNLQSLEMDIFSMWAAKENGDYRVPRARR